MEGTGTYPEVTSHDRSLTVLEEVETVGEVIADRDALLSYMKITPTSRTTQTSAAVYFKPARKTDGVSFVLNTQGLQRKLKISNKNDKKQ